MCQRETKPDGSKEAWVFYAFRYSLEAFTTKPASFIAIFCCIGMVCMYYCEQQSAQESRVEYRTFIQEQTKAMIEVSRQLTEMNTRIQYLEKN